ncbi:MAG: hypothetical protein LUH20_08770 [Lachnospiraceae bacterium]|nr:hypothetical protein [Lachnospiraceae bacterium]
MAYNRNSDLGWLFDERFVSGEGCFSQTNEYEDTQELRDTAEVELREQLSVGAADLFDAYKEYSGKITEQKCRECWVQGMAQGIRMTAEAFLTGER